MLLETGQLCVYRENEAVVWHRICLYCCSVQCSENKLELLSASPRDKKRIRQRKRVWSATGLRITQCISVTIECNRMRFTNISAIMFMIMIILHFHAYSFYVSTHRSNVCIAKSIRFLTIDAKKQSELETCNNWYIVWAHLISGDASTNRRTQSKHPRAAA